MKTIFFILILYINLFSSQLNQQIVMDVSKTFGYYQGQLYMLDTIKKNIHSCQMMYFLQKVSLIHLF